MGLVVVLMLVSCAELMPAQVRQTAALGKITPLLEAQKFDEAVVQLENHVRDFPEDDLGWTVLGNTYEELDRDEEADKAYQEALRINPKRYQALTGLGILSRKQGDYDRAMDYYRQAVEIRPDYAEAFTSMAALELRRYNDAQALEYAEKARELDKESPAIAANLALAYHYNGLFEQRDQMTEEARRLGYRNMDALDQIYRGEMMIRDE